MSNTQHKKGKKKQGAWKRSAEYDAYIAELTEEIIVAFAEGEADAAEYISQLSRNSDDNSEGLVRGYDY